MDGLAAKKLEYENRHALLVLFPKDIDTNPEAILWIRRLDGLKGWVQRTPQEFAKNLT
jgi:hypothetical protein